MLQKALISGKSQSCGCLNVENVRAANTTHGATKTPEYGVWRHMLNRCYNPKHEKYPIYGGRGITVCDAWRHDFAAFLAYVGPRPSPDHTIDRLDNNLGYQPGNVRWASYHEQNVNRSNTIMIGGVIPLASLARLHGLPAHVLENRWKRGWPLLKALRTPVGPPGIPLTTLARLHGLPIGVLNKRLRMGWPLRKALQTPVRPMKPRREWT